LRQKHEVQAVERSETQVRDQQLRRRHLEEAGSRDRELGTHLYLCQVVPPFPQGVQPFSVGIDCEYAPPHHSVLVA
jgi:hypothetical protein